MYKLFLDDERQPTGTGWTIARSYEEAVETVIGKGLMAHISFDHDLGTGPTGRDFAGWLGDYMLDLHAAGQLDLSKFNFYVHSQNPVGAENIRRYMNGLLEFLSTDRSTQDGVIRHD